MKQILFSTILVLSISCGKNEPLTQLGQGGELLAQGIGNVGEDIGQIPRILGHQFLGIDPDSDKKKMNDLDNRVSELEGRIYEIENNLESLYSMVDDLDTNQDILSSSISLQLTQLASLQIAINNVTNTVNSSENITEIIDPCGDYPNKFDEVLLKTSSGKILVYFEDGGKRFLTELPNGNFRTTDRQACNFSVSGSGVNRVVSW